MLRCPSTGQGWRMCEVVSSQGSEDAPDRADSRSRGGQGDTHWDTWWGVRSQAPGGGDDCRDCILKGARVFQEGTTFGVR